MQRRYPFFTVLCRSVQPSSAMDIFGSLVWKETDPAHMILEAIPGQADILIGDTIITSGYSFIYPKGIFIGRWSNSGPKAEAIIIQSEVRLHEDIARHEQGLCG